jgi:sulfatase maturation enzyme AslB (radical SAM superfamily)
VDRLERLSIELTNRCLKGCAFCYSRSHAEGDTRWTPDELVRFGRDCASRGVRAISFGGGEPLEYEGLFEVLGGLRGTAFRSMTTNGLLLDDGAIDRLARAGIEKIHVSIHFPHNRREIDRAIDLNRALRAAGIKSGVNLLVARSSLSHAEAARRRLHDAGIENDRIVFLPMRGRDTPTPDEVARVAGGPFQSMTCLTACSKSPRFAAVAWDKTAAWCSYTTARRPLASLTFDGLLAALDGLGLTFCGEPDDGRLVRLSRRSQHGHDVVQRGS